MVSDDVSQLNLWRSGSMEPAMYRGDLLLLSNTKPVLTAGEIVVFKIDGREIPVVHRILEARQTYVPHFCDTRTMNQP